MIARIITYSNVQFGLLAAQPNWESTVTVELDLPTDIAKVPITFQESRRNFAQTSRYTMSWRSYLSNAKDADELRIFLTRLRGEGVIVPLWPDACEIGNSVPRGGTVISLNDVPVRSGVFWIIANSDFSTYEIVTGTLTQNASTGTLTLSVGTKNAWPPLTICYPLIVGYFKKRPQPESITDETYEAELEITESSGFAARLSPWAYPLPVVGSHISAFASTPLFDIQPNFSKPLEWTEMPDIEYEQIGFLRNPQQRVYDHRNRRGIQYEYYQATRNDASRIERFWRAQRGPTLRFMVPTWQGNMRMSSDTPAANNKQILVEPTEFVDPTREAQPGDPFIALIGPDNSIDPYQLASTLDNPPTLTSTIPVGAHTAATTILSNLLLARFQDAKLKWEYTTPYLATVKIKFVELSHEYPPNTPPPLKEPAYLFYFIENGVQAYRFTSYENSIVIASGSLAGTWVPAPFSFQTVKTGLKLDQEKLEFKSFPFEGNPLAKFWPFQLDGNLTLGLYEVDANLPRSNTAIPRFYGDIWSVDSDYKATAIFLGNLFERKFPRFLYMTSDNYVQFSPPTQLPASAFKVTGTVMSVYANDPQILTVSGNVTTKPDDWFAGGWMQLSAGPGPNFERRGILHNSGSTFHIDRPFTKLQLGHTYPFDFYPGYNGSIDQCDSKFNNRINYGGHAYIPSVNPAVKAMKAKQTSGGKKG